MNGSFENIFEKYDIHWEVSKKRRKSPKRFQQTLALHKKEFNGNDSSVLSKTGLISSSVPDSTNGLNSNYSCHFNNKAKTKYYNPTRYKTLEVIRVQNVYENHKLISSSENLNIANDNCKENINLQASSSFETVLNIEKSQAEDSSQINVTTTSLNNCKRYLSDSLSLMKSDSQNFMYKQLNVATIDKRKCESINESYYSLTDLISPERTNISKLSTQPVDNSCTELDLLIDLIVQEEKNYKNIGHNRKENVFRYDDNLSCTKSCLKGGYQELFERALKDEKVKSNFLKYDKKVGLRSGQLLLVVKLETSYGLTLATVKSKDFNRNFVIAVSREMVPRLKLGTLIEAFFDDNTDPYKLQIDDKCFDIYLEPYKLLIV